MKDTILTLNEMIEHCEEVAEETVESNPSCSCQHICLRDALLELRNYRIAEYCEQDFDNLH
tara:strand:+ start:2267 stop:2449 length:183 start_codon:yes stop_codon:yes gene_type:complete